MDTQEIEGAVLAIVAKIAKCDVSTLMPESKLAEDLGMKSVSRIELAALLEESFQIKIGNFEIRKPKTIADIITLVREKVL